MAKKLEPPPLNVIDFCTVHILISSVLVWVLWKLEYLQGTPPGIAAIYLGYFFWVGVGMYLRHLTDKDN